MVRRHFLSLVAVAAAATIVAIAAGSGSLPSSQSGFAADAVAQVRGAPRLVDATIPGATDRNAKVPELYGATRGGHLDQGVKLGLAVLLAAAAIAALRARRAIGRLTDSAKHAASCHLLGRGPPVRFLT